MQQLPKTNRRLSVFKPIIDSMMVDRPTPNWDVIQEALKSLFFRYDVDLSTVGQSQRLEYSDFETIFYHLFTVIDTAECRRRFWSIYPARNPEERSKFINNAALFINNKQLIANRISASQLRMLGGEPFRRIMTALITNAAELELTTITKRLAAENVSDDLPDENLDEYCDKIEQAIEPFQVKLNDLNRSIQELYCEEQAQVDLEQEIQEKWLALMGIEEQANLSNAKIEEDKKKIFKKLLFKLEESMRNRESSRKTIAAVPETKLMKSIPESPAERHDRPKRISEYFVDLKRCLLDSPQYSPDTNQSRIIDKISQRLMEYETGVDEICLKLEDEKEKADEALMRNPEVQERYSFFEKLIPFVNIRPIDVEDTSNKAISVAELRDILLEYPDSRYDDEEILDHFDKNIL